MVYKITLHGRTYEVEVNAGKAIVLGEYDAAAAIPTPAVVNTSPAAPAPAVTGSGEAVTAPMPGTILKVNVKVGDAVQAGAVLCVLEAMKMENEITSPRAGTVSQVLVSKGASVDTGASLLILA